MARIEHSPRAYADLVEIGEFVAEQMQSLASANRVLDAIEEQLKLLARYPHAGQLRPDLSPNVRCFSVDKYNYVIFYRPLDDGIEVARVLRTSRDIPRIFFSEED